MSGSGGHNLIFNFRERLISNDLNRLQRMLSADQARALRWIYDARVDEEESGGVANVGSTVDNPLRAIILSGLRVRPEIGTANLFVEPGMVVMVDPDPAGPNFSPDDIPTKFVEDAGVQTAGQLTLTPGAVATRVDVIECKRTSFTPAQENRDIFDPTTGTFTSTLVYKDKYDVLIYRIRTGVPGGGFASVGTASGWLPLAVARVPVGAATWDAVDVWDVRPLLSDLDEGAPPLKNRPLIKRGMQELFVDDAGANVTRIAYGKTELTFGGRMVGGSFGLESGVANGIDLLGSDVVEAGFVAAASLPWYCYLAFPFGLPRWCKLTPASSGARKPGPLRGIPIYTQKGPNVKGTPTSALNLPSVLGLSGSTSNAVAAFAGWYTAGTLPSNLVVRDGMQQGGHFAGGVGITVVGVASIPSPGLYRIAYTFTDNTTHPGNATKLLVRFATTLNRAGGTSSIVTKTMKLLRFDNTTLIRLHFNQTEQVINFTLNNWNDTFDVWFDLLPTFPSPQGLVGRVIHIEYTSSANLTTHGGSAAVIGWKM